MSSESIITIENNIRKLLIKGFDRSSFIYDFLTLYDIPKSTITRIRKKNEYQIKNKLYFKPVMTDRSVIAVVNDMENEISDKKSKPRYLIATDFLEFAAKDTKTLDSLIIPFEELANHADFFLAWNGIEKIDYTKENPADIKAAERFTHLYDELYKINSFTDKTQEEKEFNLFLIRLLFLFFAEDTGIMSKGIFTNAIKIRSKEDGSDLNRLINQIFATLDVCKREDEEKWLQAFPYVNGKLFTKARTNLIFDKKSRKLILEAGELLNWNEINPDILGSMIQTVANKEQRSVSGMHYTSVENIMKLIKPLFLDSLTESYQSIASKIKGNEDKNIKERTRRENQTAYTKELKNLLERISKIKFLDPACGSGNFLIITYKELRRLEIKILAAIRELEQNNEFDFFERSKISLNHFYGIELDDFAHEVARLSLWIAEHQMNVEMEASLLYQPAFLPLQDAGNITQGNALRLDWNTIVPHHSEDEIYLIGNPPYIGSKLQNKSQKEDLCLAIGKDLKYKLMDYISGWFFKGVAFIRSANAKLAFVTTNSIFQGEQVGYIWKNLLKFCEIEFAYTSFKWGNSAAHNAGVTVAIVGLATKQNGNQEKYIFDESLTKIAVSHINPYLTNGDDTIVETTRQAMNGLPKIVFGNMPRDGGHLIISNIHEKNQIVNQYPELENYIKRYIGSEEFINDKARYVFWLNERSYQQVKDNTIILERIKAVKETRLASTKADTKQAAERPYEFAERVRYDSAYSDFLASDAEDFIQILVPATSSENREYVPIGIAFEDTIISNSAYVIYNAPIWLLGLLQSRMHMTWLRTIGGKLETRYRYSAGLVYNTFPVPELSAKRKTLIEGQVFEILDLRESLGGTLAELYNRETMPASLKEAHQKLDGIVERAYKETPFANDEERLSFLLKMYSEMKGKA